MKTITRACLLLLLAFPAAAQGFDWKQQDGQVLTLLLNNHPWSQAIKELAPEFTAKTGIRTRLDIFNEEQFRARLTTVLQARSADVDIYMSLKPREGAVFSKAGWYADLTPMLNDPKLTAPDFAFEDFGAGLRGAETIGGKLVGLPLNLEGPLFYWRKDIFQKCGVAEPMALEDLLPAAQKLKACDAGQGVWAARGLRDTVPYAMAAFIYNLGGSFATPDGKPGLCQPASLKGFELYAALLRDYGPAGATNHTFTQVIELLGQGRAAMVHESSNEFPNIMRFPRRAEDLGVKVLPPGRETGVSKPVVIGWGLSVSAFSKKQQAAWLFLQWATGPEMQAKLLKAGVAPPRTSLFQGPEFAAWTSELPIRRAWADALVQISKTGTSVYQSPGDRIPELRALAGVALQQVVLGRATAQEAACNADAEAAKIQ